MSAEAGRRPAASAPRRRLLIAGSCCCSAGWWALSLHALGAPETLLDFRYDRLLSGLDVPPDPAQTATDTVSYVSLLGGIAELAGGAVLLALSRRARLAR